MTKRSIQTTVSILGACLVVYFLYHTVQGDHGWLSMLRLKNEVASSQANLSQLQKEHAQLQHRVELMRSSSIDPDLLDEKSREMLNYSKPNEVVILTSPSKADNIVQRSK